MIKIWTIPRSDELFSSWIIRASFDSGSDPMTFTGLIYRGHRIWTQDRDRRPNSSLMHRLRDKYNFDTTLFNNAFLVTDIALTTSRTLPNRAPWPWVLPYGLRNRRSIGGLQFCQLCLTDERMYLSKRCRYAWHVVCEKHGILLHDRCAHCHRSLQIQQITFSHHSMNHCVYCKQQFHLATPIVAPRETLRLQQQLDRALLLGVAHFWGKQRTVDHLFNAVRLSMGFARTAARTPVSKIGSFLRSLSFDDQEIISPKTGLRFEMLPVHERAHLLSLSARLINIPKSDIAAQGLKTGITREHLRHILSQEETTFCSDMFVRPKTQRRHPCQRPSVQSRHQSKQNVERRLALLLRRSRIAKPDIV